MHTTRPAKSSTNSITNPTTHMKHTPTPWDFEVGEQCCFHKGNRVSIVRWSKDGPDEDNCETVAEVWPSSEDQDIEDGKLIVKAVNHYDELVDALDKAQQTMDVLAGDIEDTFPARAENTVTQAMEIRVLLAKLEGGAK
jgi:hypothetical protein